MLARVARSAAIQSKRSCSTQTTVEVEKSDKRAPRTTLTSIEGQREYFERFAKQHNLESKEAWYDVSREQLLKERGGTTIIKLYQGLVSKALAAAYPDHPFEPFRFHTRAPAAFWRDLSNQRAYFDWLKLKLDVSKPADWYTVNWEKALKRKDLGEGLRHILLTVYSGSAARAIPCIYPEQSWNRGLFPRISAIQLVDLDTKLNMVEVKSYLDHLSKELQIKKLEDWYYISMKQAKTVTGYKEIPKRLGGLPGLLIRAFPEHAWDTKKFGYGRVSSTRRGFAGSTAHVPTTPSRAKKTTTSN